MMPSPLTSLPASGRDPADLTPPLRAGRSRRVLLITFYYPPGNTSSGGLRPLKFTKYLGEFGWNPSVLTVRHGYHESADPALLQQIPTGTSVHRALCFDVKTLSIGGHYPGFLALPDRYVPWLFSGLFSALRAIRRDRIEALFSTSPIPTAHMIALFAKKATGIPWVADFRDPWVETEGSEVHAPLRQAVELRLERRVIRNADRVTATTAEFARYLRTRYPEIAAEKIVSLYNGYDEDDFKSLPPPSTSGSSFTIVHAGLINPAYRDPAPLLEALRRCLATGALPHDTRLLLIGGGPYTASEEFSRLVAAGGLEHIVRAMERMPYGEALSFVASAGVLLLLQGGDDTRMLIPAKAFEYLRTERLILALAPADSATAALIRQFSGGSVAAPNDPADIAEKLATLFAAWNSGCGATSRLTSGLERYSRRASARELAAILDATTGERKTEGGS